MSLSVETIAINRYAPTGSEAIKLYSNGMEGGAHLTIGQLAIAVAMRAAAVYEAQSVTKMNLMTHGSDVLEKAGDYMGQISDGSCADEWAEVKAFLIDELGVEAEALPADINTYMKRMAAIEALKAKVDALTQSQQTDMIDLQTLVNRRDTAFSVSSNIVRTLCRSMNTDAGNF